jgi:hypothetical protein
MHVLSLHFFCAQRLTKLKDFVVLCLSKDPTQRPGSQALMEHRFIKGVGRCEKLVELARAMAGRGGDDDGELSSDVSTRSGGYAEWTFDP